MRLEVVSNFSIWMVERHIIGISTGKFMAPACQVYLSGRMDDLLNGLIAGVAGLIRKLKM